MIFKTPGIQLHAAIDYGTATSSAEMRSERWEAVLRGKPKMIIHQKLHNNYYVKNLLAYFFYI